MATVHFGCIIIYKNVKEEAVLVREVKTIILNSSYDVKDYCRLQWEFV